MPYQLPVPYPQQVQYVPQYVPYPYPPPYGYTLPPRPALKQQHHSVPMVYVPAPAPVPRGGADHHRPLAAAVRKIDKPSTTSEKSVHFTSHRSAENDDDDDESSDGDDRNIEELEETLHMFSEDAKARLRETAITAADIKQLKGIYNKYIAPAGTSPKASVMSVLREMGVVLETDRCFTAFDRQKTGWLNFELFVLGIVALHPKTPHTGAWEELRVESIFRYYSGGQTLLTRNNSSNKELFERDLARFQKAVPPRNEVMNLMEFRAFALKQRPAFSSLFRSSLQLYFDAALVA